MTMKQFMKGYERFCFNYDLEMKSDLQSIKRRLLVEHGLKV